MTLTSAQLGLCFQSYWYMWLTNGLSGLLFIGIDIGIAAFFLKKFQPKKPRTHRLPGGDPSSRRPLSPAAISIVDDANEQGVTGPGLRGQPEPRVAPKSAVSYASSMGDDHEHFSETTLEAMNGARRQYSAKPFVLNEQLSEIAQRWAEEMARTGKLCHSPAEWRSFNRQTLGENYASSFQAELTGAKMVRKWLKEGRRYNFGFDGRSNTENFTQLVWQATQEVGIGRARSEDGNWWYGVVVFDPPGNIPNQYSSNVLLPPS